MGEWGLGGGKDCFEVLRISLSRLHCKLILKSLHYELCILVPEGFFSYAKIIKFCQLLGCHIEI